MTKEQRERLQNMLTRLDRELDRIDKKRDKAEAENDTERCKKLDSRWDMKYAEFRGIKEALEALGYSTRYHIDGGKESILVLD